MFGDAVPERADPLDDELDHALGAFSFAATRSRYHFWPLVLFSRCLRATRSRHGRRDIDSRMEQAFTEWGVRGVEALRDRVAALVIVDVLSFSTAVDVAVAKGAFVIPFPLRDRAAALAAATAAGAVSAVSRGYPGYS